MAAIAPEYARVRALVQRVSDAAVTVEGEEVARTRAIVALRLPRALRRVLARRHRLVLRITAAVTDPAGSTRVVRRTLRPRLKRPRRRAGSQSSPSPPPSPLESRTLKWLSRCTSTWLPSSRFTSIS